MPDMRWFKQGGKYKKKKQKAKPPEKPLSEKELEELRNGVMKHPALELFADEKTRQKIIFGDVKRPTEFDKFIVQESDNTDVIEKSQFAYLAKESAYIGRHLERLAEENIAGEIAEWYKRAECAFTYRLIPIQAIYEDVKDTLAKRLSNLKGEFIVSYKKMLAVAKRCDIERANWFTFLPAKPISDFKLAAAEFHRKVYDIHSEALIGLNKLTKQSSEQQKGGKPSIRKNTVFTFNPGQVLYKRQDLSLPSGEAVDIFQKLHDSLGDVVKHKDLDMQSSNSNASDTLKRNIGLIRKALILKKAPYCIEAKRGNGFFLKRK
jgi:hypothetical protein